MRTTTNEPDDGHNDLSTTIIHPMDVDGEDLQTRTLPRVDGGKDAWLVLTGCFVLEALVWGYVPEMLAFWHRIAVMSVTY